ncbi:MAG: hypothetical protein HC911_14375 [Chloroflexaceae bacterium]|nr:hypothetical protein [Chloroflexaceae bacterium]
MQPIRELVLCTGNSARSHMAEGFFRQIGGGQVRVDSAGTAPSRVHPLAIQVIMMLARCFRGGPNGCTGATPLRGGAVGEAAQLELLREIGRDMQARVQACITERGGEPQELAFK